ncbi:MAG: hypothetical protein ACLR67_05555, partial [Eggerthella lenta]
IQYCDRFIACTHLMGAGFFFARWTRKTGFPMDGDGDDEGYRQNVKQMLKMPTSYHVALVVDESIWPNQSDVHFATDFSVDTLADSKVRVVPQMLV